MVTDRGTSEWLPSSHLCTDCLQHVDPVQRCGLWQREAGACYDVELKKTKGDRTGKKNIVYKSQLRKDIFQH